MQKRSLSENQRILLATFLISLYPALVVGSGMAWLSAIDTVNVRMGIPSATIAGFPLFFNPLANGLIKWYLAYALKYPVIQPALSHGFHWSIGSLAGFFALLLLPIRTLFRKMVSKDKSDTTYGSSRFATEKDLQKLPVLNPPAPKIVIGAVPTRLPDTFDHALFLRESEKKIGEKGPSTPEEKARYEKSVRVLYFHGPGNVLAYAPTRSGKGVGLVIPTLLEWTHSSVVLDVKGENYQFTSGFRQKAGQRILRFKPSDPDHARVSKYNPLDSIRERNSISDAQDIAQVLMNPEGTTQKDYWYHSGSEFLTAAILFVSYGMFDRTIFLKSRPTDALSSQVLGIPWHLRCLGTVAKFVSSPMGADHIKWMNLVSEMAHQAKTRWASSHPGETVPEYFNYVLRQAQTLATYPPEQAAGTLGNAKASIGLFADPVLAMNTSVSDFTILDLMGAKNDKGVLVPVTLYLIVNPGDELERLRPLLRIMLSQIITHLTGEMTYENGTQKQKGPFKLLMLLDEFPQIGKLQVIQNAIAFTAGYGIYFYLIAQDSIMLSEIYGKENSIVSNCYIRIAYAANRHETSKDISEMLGQTTIVKEMSSYSKGQTPLTLNESRSTSLYQRTLLTPDEVGRIPFDSSLIMMSNAFPIYGKKVFFYAISKYASRSAIPPAVPFVLKRDEPSEPLHAPTGGEERPDVRPETPPDRHVSPQGLSMQDYEAKLAELNKRTQVTELEEIPAFEQSTLFARLKEIAAERRKKMAEEKSSMPLALPMANPPLDRWSVDWIIRNRKKSEATAPDRSDRGNALVEMMVGLLVAATLTAALMPFARQGIQAIQTIKFQKRIARIERATEYAYLIACPFGANTSPTYPPAGNCAAVSFPPSGFQTIGNEGLIPVNSLTAFSMQGTNNNTLIVQGAAVVLQSYSNSMWLLTISCQGTMSPNLCAAVHNQFSEAAYATSGGVTTLSFYIGPKHLPSGGDWGFWGNLALGQAP